jgi:hypothetical protein
MAGQIARLFARGSLMNKTARNLTQEEKRRVDELMCKIWEDPALKSQQREFCMALARIIGDEYHRTDSYTRDWKDLGAQMCELSFAFWRACVDVLYHNPKPEVVENQEARRKYFKTHMFNYLRQILNENKKPAHKETKRHTGHVHDITKKLILAIFSAETKSIQYELEEDDNTIIFHMNTLVLANKLLKKIWHIRDKMAKYGVTVSTYDDAIWIYIDPNAKAAEITLAITNSTWIKFISDASIRTAGDNDDNGFSKHVEFVATKQGSGVEKHVASKHVKFSDKEAPLMDGVMMHDMQETLMSRLDSDSQAILKIQLNPPKDFTDRYFPNRKKEITYIKDSQLAGYLGLSKEEVTRKREIIKMQAEALDLRPVGVAEED